MPEKSFRLVTLGRLALCPPAGRRDPGVDELNTRRRKLALLAVLAVRDRPVSRDTLLEMFWGGQDETRARHSLSDAVSHLRRVLGRDAIVATRTEVSAAANAGLVVDAREFAELAATDEGRARAIAMYDGAFLDGVHVSGSLSFDAWVSRERTRLERAFAKACALECAMQREQGSTESIVGIAERWLEVEPLSVDAALTLFDSLGAAHSMEGDTKVIEAYDRLRDRLARDYELEPDARLAELARRAAESLASRRAAPVSQAPVLTPAAVAIEEARHPAQPPAAVWRRPSFWRRRIAAALAAALALVAVSAAIDARRSRGIAAPSSRSVLAIAEIALSGDTSTHWLADGLPQMIAAKLARTTTVDVVPLAEIRAIRARAELRAVGLPSTALRDLGRRAGANLVLSGTFQRRNSVSMLELRLLDVRTGKTMPLEAVADSSVLSLVDRAVVRLLDAVGATSTQGPRLADLETTNLDAYQHFVRSYQLGYDHPAAAIAELDAAVALDSGFTSAVLARVTQAIADNDLTTISVLSGALEKRGARVPERDRLEWESRVTLMAGEIDRSEALARLLVERFPRDPRGYQVLATVYGNVGRWDEQERVLERLLALDSLGMEAGRGPCVSCYGLGNLTAVRMFRGDWSGAERAARRWATIAPEMHAAWTNLAMTQAYEGRFAEAYASVQRALALAPEEPDVSLALAWVQLMSRDYSAAESTLASWQSSASRTMRMQAADVRAILERERGRYRSANATLERAIAEFPELAAIDLMRIDGLARIGDCRKAVQAMEPFHGIHSATPPAPGGPSRAFAWHHAHLADAIARSTGCGNAPSLESLADSIERIARRSYYGRDWVLHHHVRGLIAEQRGDYARAESELRQAQWRQADGWTRSLAELAIVQLKRGRAADAISTLRQAYAARPDAMARYEPRSEMDYYMALAFRQLGQRDSASIYEEYTRRAWSNADPEVKRMLRALDVADVAR